MTPIHCLMLVLDKRSQRSLGNCSCEEGEHRSHWQISRQCSYCPSERSDHCTARWGFRFFYIFEPDEYLLCQVVLDLAGIGQRWHAIYDRREFIEHRVEGWHLREQDGLGRER